MALKDIFSTLLFGILLSLLIPIVVISIIIFTNRIRQIRLIDGVNKKFYFVNY